MNIDIEYKREMKEKEINPKTRDTYFYNLILLCLSCLVSDVEPR